MESILLTIAGFTIEIRFQKTEWPFFVEKEFRSRILFYYRGFIVKHATPVDYWITMVQRETFETIILSHQRKRHYINIYEEAKGNTIVSFYHASERQFQIIVRKILQKLLTKKKGMIFHASASNVNGKAYIFLGKSGAGKSTAMSMISAEFPSLADDTIILKKEKKIVMFYQTPFHEKNSWVIKKSMSLPLGKIFFLIKSPEYRIEKIQNKEQILKMFIEQFFTEEKDAKKQVQYALNFIARFNHFYFLHFSLQSQEKMIELIANSVKIEYE